MSAEIPSGVRVDRRDFVRLALRSAALGALGATGGYLAWRSGPAGECPRPWPCAQCGLQGRCVWSGVVPASQKTGG